MIVLHESALLATVFVMYTLLKTCPVKSSTGKYCTCMHQSTSHFDICTKLVFFFGNYMYAKYVTSHI